MNTYCHGITTCNKAPGMILAYVAVMARKISGQFDATTNDDGVEVISRYFLPAYRVPFTNKNNLFGVSFYKKKVKVQLLTNTIILANFSFYVYS